MRQAAKTDQNQGIIVEALRAAGCTVEILAQHGHGLPDLLVGIPHGIGQINNVESGRVAYHGANLLMEVKTPDGRHTPDQKEFMQTWPGPIVTVRSVNEALHAVGRI